MSNKKLSFTLSLIDKLSKPAKGAYTALNDITEKATAGFAQMGIGGAAMWGAGQAMGALTNDARVMNKALAEVSSLDVSDSALQKLNAQALQYSVQYGESAAAFVSSSYDIQSAIAGLTGDELAGFTNASNVLAKATKADSGTITSYMGTMYGIFKNQAAEMGNAKWVEQITGKTATAVQMFKTTGMEMSGAFSALGANATAAGISASEQMAVLGTLQSTMSGSEAGTKYKAFLGGIGDAQAKLGLKFTDGDGNMLGVLDIMNKIKGKFGDTLDVAEGDILKKAFGSDEAVAMVKQLMADTDGLGESLKKLESVKGMDKATQMAKKMVDPFDQLGAGTRALSTAFGQALLPALNPLVESMANGASTLTSWIQEYPTLTAWIGKGVIGVIALTGVLGGLAAVSGTMRILTLGYTTAQQMLTWVTNKSTIAMRLQTGVMKVLNLVMANNPIGWVVKGALLLTGVLTTLYYNWESVRAGLADTSWGAPIIAVLDCVFDKFKLLGEGWDWFMDKIGLGSDIEQTVEVTKKAAPAMPVPDAGAATQQYGAAIPNQPHVEQVQQATEAQLPPQVVQVQQATAAPIPPQVVQAQQATGAPIQPQVVQVQQATAAPIPPQVVQAQQATGVAPAAAPAMAMQQTAIPAQVQPMQQTAELTRQAAPNMPTPSIAMQAPAATPKLETPQTLVQHKETIANGGNITKNVANSVNNNSSTKSRTTTIGTVNHNYSQPQTPAGEKAWMGGA